jgi:hypothetical protein
LVAIKKGRGIGRLLEQGKSTVTPI